VAGIVVTVLGSVLIAIQWRLNDVENQLEQDLRDTVEIELAALRIGNRQNFMDVQRSASQDWLNSQEALFDEYQQIKQLGEPGNYKILDVTLDDERPRARVLIEQVINGQKFRTVWFYWRYNDLEGEQNGWRHVPPDVEFWGAEHTLKNNFSQVVYYDLDKTLAEKIAPLIEQWWREGCTLLSCPNAVPRLTITIVPHTMPGPTWDLYDFYNIVIPSPLIEGRANYSQLPDPQLVATLRAMVFERVVEAHTNEDIQASPYTDTYWIATTAQNWLQEKVGGQEQAGSAFFDTLVSVFGADFPGRMMQNFTANTDIGFMQLALGLPVPQLTDEQINALAWSEFFQWRLRAEQAAQGIDPEAYRTLYDTLDGNAMTVASERFANRNPNSPIPRVVGVTINFDEFGRRLANVAVLPNPDDSATQAIILFRWTGTTWKRIN
jgi:hypothetical protein